MDTTHRGPGRPPLDGGYYSRVSVRLPYSDITRMSVLTHSVSTLVRVAIKEKLERIKNAHNTKRAAAPGGS